MVLIDTMKNVSEKAVRTSKITAYDVVYTAMAVTLVSVCSWITIPMTVPFTMQTFGVFVSVALFGLYRGTAAVLIYLALGALGAPIFSGFNSGIGYLLGNTGGYLIGFLFAAIVSGLIIKLFGQKPYIMFLGMAAGLIVCYAFGTLYFIYVYTKNAGSVGLLTVLTWCVFPFIIPDILKIILAAFIAKRFSKYVKGVKSL